MSIDTYIYIEGMVDYNLEKRSYVIGGVAIVIVISLHASVSLRSRL